MDIKKLINKVKDSLIGEIISVIISLTLSFIYTKVFELEWSSQKFEIISVFLFIALIICIIKIVVLKRRIWLYEKAMHKLKAVDSIKHIDNRFMAIFQSATNNNYLSSDKRLSDFLERTIEIEKEVINECLNSLETVLRQNIFSQKSPFELKYYILDKDLTFSNVDTPNKAALTQRKYLPVKNEFDFNTSLVQLNDSMIDIIMNGKDSLTTAEGNIYPLQIVEKIERSNKTITTKIIYGFLHIKVNAFVSNDLRRLIEKICLENCSILVYYLRRADMLSNSLNTQEGDKYDFLKSLTQKRLD
ncbi:hypothetical protein QE657_07605 [Streptococcus suis]|uniref:hypothetical protein n=1 Tax=Streptococcus suis TaxID=1307 RepID=UPI003757E134